MTKSLSLKKILVIRNDVLGDVILTLPFIQSLKKTYPEAQIHVLVQPYTKAILETHKAISGLIVDKRKLGKVKGIKGFIKYVRFIKALEYDAVFHAVLNPYEAFLCKIAGIPIRVGDGKKVIESLTLTHKVKFEFDNFMTHESDMLKSLLTGLNPEAVLEKISGLEVEKEAGESLEKTLRSKGLKEEEPYLVLHVSTGGGNRAWGVENYAKLVQKIHSNTPCRCVVTGFGETEEAQVTALMEALKDEKLISLCNQTTLKELVALIKNAEAVVGTDTGPTHIAGALSKKVLCISPTKFVKSLRWAPLSGSLKVISNSKVCPLSCYPWTCKYTYCTESISVEAVYSTLLELLNMQSQTKEERIKEKFKASMGIALIPNSKAEKEKAIKLKEKYETEGVNIQVWTHSDAVLRIFKKTIQSDITMIKTNNRYIKQYITILRPFLALKMYAPPVVHSFKTEEGIDFILDCMQEFEK